MKELIDPVSQQGNYIHANGIDIYYEEYGQGEPMLLIHGGALTASSWGAYIELFAQHYRVIAPDSRAHGRTINTDTDLSFGLLAEDMVALVQVLGLTKPVIFGYSDGGQIAMEIGMRFPELPEALIIGGAYAELTEGSSSWVRSILGDPGSPDVDTDKFEREQPGFAEMLKRTNGPEGWKTFLRQIKPMWNATLNHKPEEYARVTAPTLIIAGDRDGFVPVEESTRMYRLLPNAELAIVPGAEHGDFIFSPAKIAVLQPLILDFLKRHNELKQDAVSSAT